MVEAGLTKGTGRKFGIFIPDTKEMLITPSGIDYFEITPSDIVVMDIEGRIISGGESSFQRMGDASYFYQQRKDLQAIIHAHTTYCATIACLREDLPAVHYMIAVAGKMFVVQNMRPFGTKELAQNAYDAMQDRKAVLLANHGILTGGVSLADAFNVLEEVEYTAQLYYLTRSMGNPIILDDGEMELMKEKFQNYGQKKCRNLMMPMIDLCLYKQF